MAIEMQMKETTPPPSPPSTDMGIRVYQHFCVQNSKQSIDLMYKLANA